MIVLSKSPFYVFHFVFHLTPGPADIIFAYFKLKKDYLYKQQRHDIKKMLEKQVIDWKFFVI